MKRTLIFLLAWHTAGALSAQQVRPAQQAQPAPPVPTRSASAFVDPATGLPPKALDLIRFGLDFPGGSPAEFIAAVSQARGREVNAIIPQDYEDTRLPAMRVKDVNIVQLFQALEAASRRTVTVPTGQMPGSFGPQRAYSQFTTSFGFRTEGEPSDDAIWYFYREEPVMPSEPPPKPPERRVRYFQLGPYLDEYKLEDITTAIQTGWKMSGQEVEPEMKFHENTRLLIVVGDVQGLEVVSQVLSQLERGIKAVKALPPAPAPAAAAPPPPAK